MLRIEAELQRKAREANSVNVEQKIIEVKNQVRTRQIFDLIDMSIANNLIPESPHYVISHPEIGKMIIRCFIFT